MTKLAQMKLKSPSVSRVPILGTRFDESERRGHVASTT
jgi:hypothetical protein